MMFIPKEALVCSTEEDIFCSEGKICPKQIWTFKQLLLPVGQTPTVLNLWKQETGQSLNAF